ncbi:MAG: hypothetical protein ACO1PW_03655 [Actinomycetota bacterium]
MTPRWAAAASLVAAATLVSGACSDDEGSALSPPPTDAVILETTTSTTEAPITGEPLVVVDQGVSSFPDPYDPSATLGGYGVILENPNPEAMAAGVHVSTRILDPAGTELLVDRALLNAVMPGQRMAVGRTLIEPIEEPTQLEVTVEVTVWLRPSSAEGTLVVDGVVTEPEANGGAVTRFTVRSTWPQAEEGVDATAVYRAEDGRILAAESTTLSSVPPNAEAPGQIRLLSPIPSLAATEVYVGRGIAAQTAG